MRSIALSFAFGGLCLVLSACQATVGSAISVPADAATQCVAQCQHIGLPLNSVVVMASNVGCVCGGGSGDGARAAAAAGGGMTALMMEQETKNQQSRTQTALH